ncbi:hypothetical protein PI124_g14458 [Phytophthora idaei]|nr:hypothetical protein PI125_g14218 [Phytophthora idaei]KAG3146405.1 hypothetical protein PI126_g13341 [Phytophthora idaei]KAG3240659.1 hypothetical protein PI124_g14458 [Phytophthora idaei]
MATPPEKVVRPRTTFTNAQRLQICNHKEQNPTITQGQLATWAQEALDLPRKPSQAMISKLLKRKPDLESMTTEELVSNPLTVEELLNLPEESVIMDEPTDEDFCAPVESVKVVVQQPKPKPADDGGLSVEELKERLKWIAKLLIYADEKGVSAESLQHFVKLRRKILATTMNDQKYMDAFDHDVTKRKADFLHKVAQVRSLMQELKHDAVVLSLSANFAWITSGARSYVFMATEGGAGSIYVDATQVAVLTNEMEGHKLVNEEMRGLEEVVILVQDPWYAQRSHADVAKELSKSDKIAVDATNSALSGRLAELRSTLTEYEMEVFRALGKDCGEIIGQVARAVRPTMTADERVDNIRHPLPTKKRVKNKAMLVICGQRAGLIASTTRLVYITTTPNATMPEDLVRRHEAATYVDTVLIANTRGTGVKAGDMLKLAQDAYAEKGYEGEWKFHHQGGCAAYKSREWVANPSINRVTGLNQAYAWNPSVAGTKSEDTVLCYANAEGKVVVETITCSPDWPMIEHTIGDVTIARPKILHLQY